MRFAVLTTMSLCALLTANVALGQDRCEAVLAEWLSNRVTQIQVAPPSKPCSQLGAHKPRVQHLVAAAQVHAETSGRLEAITARATTTRQAALVLTAETIAER